MDVRLTQKKTSYTFDYPAAIEFAETQNDIFWTANEINVEKDIQDIKVNMTEAEAHGVITTLRLFTLYELIAGTEYWGGRVMKSFPRPDIQRMANSFGFFELNVHAPFYNKLNEALNLNTDEFYLSYVDDPLLNDRMNFVEDCVCDKNLLLSLGAFSMIEGAVLYSSFAFLKHFQAQGKNKLLNVVRGINFSVRDEALHSEGGAWLFKTLKQELIEKDPNTYNDEYFKDIEESLHNCAREIYEHECRIVDMIFEKGKIEGITATQLKNFVASRVDVCLTHLGIKKIYNIKYNPIADWFYQNINTVQLHDFFTGIGNQYNRDWDEGAFVWQTA